MFCLNCGKELPDSAAFCDNCGHRVDGAASATQETVVVPEIPGEALFTEPNPVDRPTVVVPEVPVTPHKPQTDPLDEMYPDAADQPERGNLAGLVIGLIAATMVLASVCIVVILGAMNNWWRTAPKAEPDATTTPSSSVAPEDDEPPSTDPGDEEDPDATELRQKLEKRPFNGLFLYLGNEFMPAHSGDGVEIFRSTDGNSELTVTHRWLTTNEKTISDYAYSYTSQYRNTTSTQNKEKFGNKYWFAAFDDNTFRYVGFYVRDGYGWTVEIKTNAENDDFLNYVTLCQFDKSFQLPEKAELKEQSFAGLYLNMDSNFVPTIRENFAMFTYDGTEITVQLTPIADMDADSSKAYAELYYSKMDAMEWKTIDIRDKDNHFFYVLLIDNNDKVTIEGLYTYGQTGWIVTGTTRNEEDNAALLESYIVSGVIEPTEVPTLEGSLTSVTLNGLTLPLEKGFHETFRGEYVSLRKDALEIFIFTNRLSELGDFTSAHDVVMADYNANLYLWNNVRLYTINGVECLMTWDDRDGAESNAYGYYLLGEYFWKIQVRVIGQPDEDALLGIVSGASIDPNAVDDRFYEDIVVSNRDRIEMTGQSTDVYEGLQVSFAPEWTPDTTISATGDYIGEKFSMMTSHTVLTAPAASAADYAIAAARELSPGWGNCEVGMAGQVPYVLLYDDTDAEDTSFMVIGIYADGVHYWEIQINCSDFALVDEAIWYATAGVIL